VEEEAVRTALVTTCYREASAIGAFLDAVLAQTRRPDEIIIVDAGSDDGTVERIRERISAGAPVRLIVEPSACRSRGRNLAVAESTGEVIVVTDVGALPRRDWFERIVAPLEADPSIDVVAGYYEAEGESLWERAVAAAIVPVADEVDPETFLPSARSIAFRREVWARVGGYPEEARFNEDTPFDLALKALGARFVFEPSAVVRWLPEASVGRLFRQFFRYARGDAQCRLWFRHYAKAYIGLGLGLAIIVAAALWWWPLLLLLPLLGVAYWARHAARAYKRTRSLAAAALAPAANLIVDLAHLIGYTRGLLDRRHGRANANPTGSH